MTSIKIKSLTKSYGEGSQKLTVIDNLNYEFANEQSVAIVGPSGIGKSTLLHLLSGIDAVTSGTIEIDGVDITKLTEDELAHFRLAHLGFIFQFHHLLPEFSALENVALPLYLEQVPDIDAHEQAKALLCEVGLGERLTHLPSQLSGGEQQRVALARAMINKPKLIFADEPTGNLDSLSAELVCEQLLSLKSKKDYKLIIVTHSKEVASLMDLTLELTDSGELKAVVQ